MLRSACRTVANYLMWRISAASVGSLNEAARALQLKYSAALTGTTERKPRWEECTDLVSGRYQCYASKQFQLSKLRNNGQTSRTDTLFS